MFCGLRTAEDTTRTTREGKNRRRSFRRRTSLCPLMESLEVKLVPAVFTWTGAAGLLADGWSNTGNWQVDGSQPALAPGTGDQLVFPAGVTQKTADNELGTNIAFQSITIEDSGYDIYGDRLDLTGSLSLSATSVSSTYEIATTYVAGASVSVASGSQLSVSGHTTLAADTDFDVAAGATLSLNTDIVQDGSDHTLTKSGLGTLIISPTYSGTYGPTDVAGGTLQIDGSLDATQPVSVGSGATLSGTGSVGPVSAIGGIIAPGDDGPGILTVAGLNLSIGAQFAVDLDGNTPGTGYDQVITSGPVVLAGATLVPTVFGYTPTSTDHLVLIQNDSGNAISGTFSNFPTQMGLVTVGSGPSLASFMDDYDGLNQSGDDLVLDGLNPTTTTLNVSAGPYTYGNTITFTANVSSDGSPAADGATVELFDNTMMIGSPDTIASGLATFNISTLAAGAYTNLHVMYLGDDNFAPSQSSGMSLLVQQRAITVSAAVDTKTYNGTTSSTAVPMIVAGSLAAGDTADFSEVFDSRNAGARTLTASGIVNDGDGGANYSYTFLTASGTINQLAITVTAASDTKTYDGTVFSTAVPLITGALETGDVADFTQSFDSRNAGPRTLTPSGTVNDGNGGANYSYTFLTSAGTINQLAITVTAASDTKTYDGTVISTAVPLITGALGIGDLANFTQSFDSRNAGARTLTASGIVNDGNAGANYSYTFLTSAGTINQLALTVTAASDTKTYDGTTTSTGIPAITGGSLAPGDTTTNFVQAFDSRNAGPRNLVASGIVNDGNAGANYSYTFVTATGTINQLALTVSAASDTKTYDGTTDSAGAPTITAGSLATGDTSTSFVQAFDSRNAGPRTLTASGIVNDGNDGANYSYTFLTASGTINQLAITVTATPDSKTYDGTVISTAVPIIIGGLGAGDVGDFTQSFDSRNAGSRTLTASGTVNDGNGGANYSYTFLTSAGTINQLAITVTAAGDTKTYDGTTISTGVPIITGALGIGDLANFTQSFDSRNAGARTLAASGTVNDGNGGANYSYTFLTSAGTINQLAITVTAASDTKTYDGTTTSTGIPAITGGSLAPGDTTTNFVQAFDSRNAGPRNLVASGIVNDGNGGANYTYTFLTATGTINQLAITVTAVTDTKTYDGTTSSDGVPSITAGSLAPCDTTTTFMQLFESRNAGARTLTPGGIVNDGNDGANYSYTFLTASGTINQLAITVTAATDTKTYDGTANSTAMPIITGGLGAADVADFTQTFDSRNAGVRTLTASGDVNDGNGGDNYTYTFLTAPGTINQLAITVTAATDTKTYDGTITSTDVPIIIGGLGAGDVADFTQTFDSRNAGARTLTASGDVNDGNDGDNYSYTFLTATGTITQLAITVTAASDTKTYDGTTTSTGIPAITGGSLAPGDTTTNFVQAFDSRNAGPRNLVASGIVNDGNAGANYSYAFATAPGTINQRALTVSATSDTRTYDGTTASAVVPSITAGSLATGDTTASFAQVFDNRNAGARTLTATGIINDGNAGANYSYTFLTASGTINQLAITVTAATDTKTYDGTSNSTAAPIITGGLGAGDVADFTQTFDSRNAGARTLTVSGDVNDGNGGNNYTYTFVTSAGTITQLAITVTAASDTKTYDGTTTSTGVPIITGGLGAGDLADFTQTFDSRNAGARDLTASGDVNDGNGGANYTYTFLTAPGTINQLAITVSAATDTKTYDGTTTSTGVPTITAGSLATGDSATSFTQVFDSRNAGARVLNASGIVNDGNGGDNYSYTFLTASGTINQLAITVSAASDTKTYDGTTDSEGAPTITAGSLATGDTTTSFVQAFDSRNAGAQTLTPSGIVNDGNGGNNYSYTFLTAPGIINQLAITVTAATDTKTYDGTVNSTAVPIITGGLGAGDVADFAQSFDSRNAGARTLTASGTVNDGNGGDNYTYTFVTSAGTINQLAITVTAASDTKTYDGTTTSTGVPTITTGGLAAGDTTTTFTQVFDSRNAGARTLIASGIVNDGNGGDNYSYTFLTSSGTINQLAITVTAASDTKTYDGTTDSAGVPTITAGALAAGDSTTNFIQAFDSRNAGARTLTASGIVNDGNGGDNYSYTFVVYRPTP